MTSPEDVLALARAVMGRIGPSTVYCAYCWANISREHRPDCPVPIAHRVIAEAEKKT